MARPRAARRRRTARLVCLGILAAVCGMASTARAELRQLTLTGEVRATGEARKATLHVLCEPAAKGTLSLELWVSQAFTLEDFDYDDFEGPDAVAADRALSHVSVGGDASRTEIEHAAAGWYAGEDPDAFVFGLHDPPHSDGKLAMIVRALRPDHTELVWVQRSFDEPARVLRATFTLNAATIASIRATVDPCLTPAAKPAKKPK